MPDPAPPAPPVPTSDALSPPAGGRAPSAPRRLIGLLRGALDRREREPALAAHALDRAERVLDTLDRAALTLERVARVELALVERLVPIVEDLGELVRHELDDARRRRADRGQPPLARSRRAHLSAPDIIDAE